MDQLRIPRPTAAFCLESVMALFFTFQIKSLRCVASLGDYATSFLEFAVFLLRQNCRALTANAGKWRKIMAKS